MKPLNGVPFAIHQRGLLEWCVLFSKIANCMQRAEARNRNIRNGEVRGQVKKTKFHTAALKNKVHLFFPGSQVRQKCTRILLQLEV
jgi:hypothetical protein